MIDHLSNLSDRTWDQSHWICLIKHVIQFMYYQHEAAGMRPNCNIDLGLAPQGPRPASWTNTITFRVCSREPEWLSLQVSALPFCLRASTAGGCCKAQPWPGLQEGSLGQFCHPQQYWPDLNSWPWPEWLQGWYDVIVHLSLRQGLFKPPFLIR